MSFVFDSLEQENEMAIRADATFVALGENASVARFYENLPALYRKLQPIVGEPAPQRRPPLRDSDAELARRISEYSFDDEDTRYIESRAHTRASRDARIARLERSSETREDRISRELREEREEREESERLEGETRREARERREASERREEREEREALSERSGAEGTVTNAPDLLAAFAEAENALVESREQNDEAVQEEVDTLTRAAIPTADTLLAEVVEGVSDTTQAGLEVDQTGWGSGAFVVLQQMLPSDYEDTQMLVELLYLNRAAPNIADAIQQVLPSAARVPLLLMRATVSGNSQFLSKRGATQQIELDFSGELELEGKQEIPLFTSFDVALKTLIRFLDDISEMSYEEYRRKGAGKMRQANPRIPIGTTFRVDRAFRAQGLFKGSWNSETTVLSNENYVVESHKIDESGEPYYIIREPLSGMPWRAKIPAEVLERLVPIRTANPSPVLPAAYALTSAVGLSSAIFDLAKSLRSR